MKGEGGWGVRFGCLSVKVVGIGRGGKGWMVGLGGGDLDGGEGGEGLVRDILLIRT